VRPLKSLGEGFLVATAGIWLFVVLALFNGGDSWLAMLYLLILLVPALGLTYLKLKGRGSKPLSSHDKWRGLLFSLQGVALACWMFDIATTFYAINVSGLAVELNPLGWPLGLLGAFAYYAPTLIFAYLLLFKMKGAFALYGAIPLTLITLGMAGMNLLAGTQNFQVFVDTAVLATGLRYGFLALIVFANLIVPLAIKKTVAQSKAVLS
jgi:hypothetical protein